MDSSTPGEGSSRLDMVRHTLRTIKKGMNARAVGVFDDDLATMYATTEASPEAFWDVFSTTPCWSFDRQRWYRELRSSAIGEVRHECACPVRHTTDGYLIHGRWVLMI